MSREYFLQSWHKYITFKTPAMLFSVIAFGLSLAALIKYALNRVCVHSFKGWNSIELTYITECYKRALNAIQFSNQSSRNEIENDFERVFEVLLQWNKRLSCASVLMKRPASKRRTRARASFFVKVCQFVTYLLSPV